jgi:chloramphenicol-sensitive protein RarD
VSVPSEEDKRPAVASEPVSVAGSRLGLWYGLICYLIWGVIPLYFHLMNHVSPWIILCHRVVWSAGFLAVVVTVRREWRSILPVVRSRRNLIFLFAGSLLIATNWLVFIYAVSTQQVLQASFGYFINPVLSIALGMIFLHERLRRWQWVAVCIAFLALVNLSLRETSFPWIAISLAVSFGFYGLVRKKVSVNSLHGLLVETVLLVPAALLTIEFMPHARPNLPTFVLLSLSGVITAVPLLMFGVALRLLKLSTVGFLQYVGPTLQFLCALVVFREPLDRTKLFSFVLSWVAIAIYVADSVLTRHPQAVADEPE